MTVIERISYDCENGTTRSRHDYGRNAECFYREHGTDTVTARHGTFHTHSKSALFSMPCCRFCMCASHILNPLYLEFHIVCSGSNFSSGRTMNSFVWRFVDTLDTYGTFRGSVFSDDDNIHQLCEWLHRTTYSLFLYELLVLFVLGIPPSRHLLLSYWHQISLVHLNQVQQWDNLALLSFHQWSSKCSHYHVFGHLGQEPAWVGIKQVPCHIDTSRIPCYCSMRMLKGLKRKIRKWFREGGEETFIHE